MKNIEKIITLIIVLILFGYTLVSEILPKIKNNLGSSDSLLLPSSYEDIVEFKINNNFNFAVVTKGNKIIHLLFFNEEASCLYNKNIENKSISNALYEIVEILLDKNILTNNSEVLLTKYENKSYKNIKTLFINILSSKNITINLSEKTSSIKSKLQDLGKTPSENEKYLITELDMYSKEIINRKKEEPIKKDDFTKEEIVEYANNVYQKLTNYVITNNIVEQDRTSAALPIHLIPATTNADVYPSINSWYYVTNKEVYAYIRFEFNNSSYDFCYQGSISAFKEGEC